MRSISSHFLDLSIVDPHVFVVEQAERERVERERLEQEQVEQEFLFRCLKPVETGYHRGLHCMEGTRQSILNQIMDWVANQSGEEDVLQNNAYWFYGSPGIGKTPLAHSICVRYGCCATLL